VARDGRWIMRSAKKVEKRKAIFSSSSSDAWSLQRAQICSDLFFYIKIGFCFSERPIRRRIFKTMKHIRFVTLQAIVL
jgi:hypothetical protein